MVDEVMLDMEWDDDDDNDEGLPFVSIDRLPWDLRQYKIDIPAVLDEYALRAANMAVESYEEFFQNYVKHLRALKHADKMYSSAFAKMREAGVSENNLCWFMQGFLYNEDFATVWYEYTSEFLKAYILAAYKEMELLYWTDFYIDAANYNPAIAKTEIERILHRWTGMKALRLILGLGAAASSTPDPTVEDFIVWMERLHPLDSRYGEVVNQITTHLQSAELYGLAFTGNFSVIEQEGVLLENIIPFNSIDMWEHTFRTLEIPYEPVWAFATDKIASDIIRAKFEEYGWGNFIYKLQNYMER